MRYQRLKRTLRGLLMVGITAGFLSGCGEAVSETADTTTVKPVKLLSVADYIVSPTDIFLAEVDATKRAQLSFQVGGEVDNLSVRMGQRVSKGDVLATLDQSDLKLSLDSAQASYALAKTQWERSKRLFAKKLVSADVYDQSETQFKATQARYETARTELSYTQLVAPFDGVVAYTFVKQNQVVGAKQQILNLIDNTQLDVTFSMPVIYVEKRGIENLSSQEIWVTMDSDPTSKIPASFKEISTQPNTDTNTFEAIVTFERPAFRNLLSGMTGQVHITKGQTEMSLRLPESAWVSKQGNQGSVWIMDPTSHAVSKVNITTNDKGEVVNGLSQNDLVVVAGVESLYEGQVVKAWLREEGI
ncbi:efflux RND transporter periplasmic adaptor subunit [Enterovibrio qingdaonensis]